MSKKDETPVDAGPALIELAAAVVIEAATTYQTNPKNILEFVGQLVEHRGPFQDEAEHTPIEKLLSLIEFVEAVT